jgi:hypothetical protein
MLAPYDVIKLKNHLNRCIFRIKEDHYDPEVMGDEVLSTDLTENSQSIDDSQEK